MSRKLSPKALEILRSAATHGWHVDDENLVDVADLVRAGFVALESDYDVIKVSATEAGVKAALRRKLVEWGVNSWGGRQLTYA